MVPRLVEHNAAPAAKAWRGVAGVRERREKERVIGRAIPVIATEVDRNKFFFKAMKFVSRPPVSWISTQPVGIGYSRGKNLHRPTTPNPNTLTAQSHFLMLH